MQDGLLVAQHVCADRTCDQSTDGTQRSTAHLVAQKRTACTTYECRAETTLTVRRATWCAGLAVLAGLLAIALRLVLLFTVAGLMLSILWLVLARRWVGRVATACVIALVVLARGSAVAVLLGSAAILVMRRCWVLALSWCKHEVSMLVNSAHFALTCCWGWGLCPWPYWSC